MPSRKYVLLILLGDEILRASLVQELTGVGIREARTHHLLTTTVLVAEETTLLVSGLHDDVVVLHDEEEGELLPAGNHLVALLAAVV